MNKWSFDWLPINTSIYLEQEMIKAIIDFHFNLGKGVAHLETASKGLSILACRSCTSAETKRICKHECTLLTMEKTRQLDELLRLSARTGGQFLCIETQHCHVNGPCVGAF